MRGRVERGVDEGEGGEWIRGWEGEGRVEREGMRGRGRRRETV